MNDFLIGIGIVICAIGFLGGWSLGMLFLRRYVARDIKQAFTAEEPDPCDPYNGDCWRCEGDGTIDGADMASQYDDGLIDPDRVYICPCCKGSGRAEDCTYW